MVSQEALQRYKQHAANKALEFIQPGMRVGLGSGSTADAFIDQLGARVSQGLEVVCVASSIVSEHRARSLGLAVAELNDLPRP